MFPSSLAVNVIFHMRSVYLCHLIQTYLEIFFGLGANQSVSKLFLDCHSRLKEFKQSLISETEDVDAEYGSSL